MILHCALMYKSFIRNKLILNVDKTNFAKFVTSKLEPFLKLDILLCFCIIKRVKTVNTTLFVRSAFFWHIMRC
jgi:hypothetical protein